MEVLKSEKKLCAVEATTFLVEFLFTLKMVEEFSSINESTPSQSAEGVTKQGGTRTQARDTTFAPTGS
jgi:hypothetical protein